MRHVLNLAVAAVASLLVVIGWKPLLGLETFHIDLEIVALGSKSPQAKGSEVWLRPVDWPEGVTVDELLASASPAAGWEKRGEAALSHQHQPASLSWQGTVGPEARLAFTRHDWSGEVELRINGSERVHDLYEASGAGQELVVELKQVPSVFRDSLTSLRGTLLPAAAIMILGLGLYYRLERRR